MKYRAILYCTLLIFLTSCYNQQDELTSISTFEIDLLESVDNIVADGDTNYQFVLKLPGIRYGNSKQVTVKTTWGSLENNTNITKYPVAFNESADAYLDTILLKAGRTPGPFKIEINQDSTHLKTLNLNAKPNYPSIVQILSD